MQVSNPNNVKIYNLSAGKSLPQWLSDRRKRSLQKQDVDLQRRIELLQDFEMPTVSHCVRVTNDGQYICAAGTYKPKVRCYDVSQMSLKFERGLDSDVVKFQFLSDDYSKIVFLQNDRYIELHSQNGRYYRLRIPKYGRDMAYHTASCDLYVAGVSSQIYRLNLEQGRFLNPLSTNSSEVNCCELNPVHHLLACGTNTGHVECFDPRVRSRVGILDTVLNQHVEDLDVSVVPTVTALKFRDALTMAVGTSTGHVLLYDLRSDKPVLIKDHQYELPIKSIEFHDSLDLVMSMDSKILKLWNRNNGKAYTAIEPGTDLNDLCVVPGSGLLFMATEAPKVLTYYIPSIGTAPKWCSFLDNLTEELEESSETQVYDDYKFLTRRELEDLGLSHLIGSNLLRAYMHGFFIDMRLYHKAKSIAEPFAYEKYRKNKIREKIEEERENRVRLKKLPKVNPDFARKLMEAKEEAAAGNKKKMKKTPDIMEDSRFSAMFKDTDFHIDTTSEEFRLLNPVVSKLDKSKKKKAVIEQQFDEIEKEDDHDSYDDSSSDDEHTWTQEVKKQHKLLRQEDRDREREKRLKFYEIKEGQSFKSLEDKNRKKELKQTLAERLEKAEDTTVVGATGAFGNKEMTFKFKKSQKELKRQEEYQAHRRERKQVRRSAGEITKELKQKPKYWMGKRVK
ncbi:nucleolar protein 10-like [Mytilus californianus]|uniref:nucleolar protein 10-like n=1 Tax=Mytilus californianus TaxID=6549 RepID=UPI002245C2D2|nr:nucleolar protein 10-like [Mytilus californianus]